MLLRMAGILGLSLYLAGCLSLFTGPTTTTRASFDKYGLKGAEFEMGCSKESMQVVGLNFDLGEDRPIFHLPGTKIGVLGGGKKAVYIFVRGAGWVLQSLNGAPVVPAEETNAQNP